jgi:hypothetical protein
MFSAITPGYSVEQQGNNLVLYFGDAPDAAGDFNGDGVVNAADYVVWRKRSGSPEQYATWRSHFGAAGGGAGAGASAAPEPAAWHAVLVAAALMAGCRSLRVFGRFLQE